MKKPKTYKDVEELLKDILSDTREEGIKNMLPELQELLPLGNYDEFSEYSKDEQDAWGYLEHSTPDGAQQVLAYNQGVFDGVCKVLEKLGIECSY